MKNLNQLFNKQINTNCINVKHLTLDTTTNVLITKNRAFLCDEKNHVYSLELTNNNIDDDDVVVNNSSSNLVKLLEINNNVIGLELLTLNNELCMATEDGEVMVYDLNSKLSNVVSYCDGGIYTMSWSPDQEIIVFITKMNKLVLMNSLYDPINEIPFNANVKQFGDQEFVTVGWGKKETQFHGTEGKSAATKKINYDELTIPMDDEYDKHKITIDWRGDCEYFVISFFNNSPSPSSSNTDRGCRLFKVYNKEGNLQYTCEKSIGLQSPMCWRPSGLWIAIPQILPDQYFIALYEKNGLRHREIELPFEYKNEKVMNLSWSSDSEILAIQTFNKINQFRYIYLYTICNYHWYLKQCLEFMVDIQIMKWDNRFSEGRTLHVFLQNGTYCLYRFEYTINHSNGQTIDDESIVGVIDGSKILLTNFRKNVIPPPMAAYTLELPLPINYIDFLCYNQQHSINSFFTIDMKNQLTFHSCQFAITTTTTTTNNANNNNNVIDDTKQHQTIVKTFQEINCLGTFSLSDVSVFEPDDVNNKVNNNYNNSIPILNLQHVIWLNDKHFIIIYFEMCGGTIIELLEINLNPMEIKRLHKLKYNNNNNNNNIVIMSITKLNSKEFICCTFNGAIIRIRIESNQLIPFDQQTPIYQLPEYCEQICAIKMNQKEFNRNVIDNENNKKYSITPTTTSNNNTDDAPNDNNINLNTNNISGCDNENLKVFALKLKQTLYLNEKKIATDVTSMYLTENFLIFTTLNQLKFLHLYNNEILTSYERRMERGGKIVICVPKDSKIVIQMPRGNLEVIQPRILSIGIVGHHLDNCQYRMAFDVLRKQRINLNLLVDHSPIKFLNEIEYFIEQIDVNWLNLFLTDLQNDDCTQTMYAYNYKDRIPVYPDEFWFQNKINIVCDEICGHLINADYYRSNKILSILTSYVKRKNLEMALQLIWDLKKKELPEMGITITELEKRNDQKPKINASVRSLEALRYLLYLVDVNELYNVALGMYNFDLVLFVATKSQKDPKEYLPFLNNLKQYDDNYRKYKIDSYLKRYEKSLEHIVKCDESKNDECLELIEKHNLYNRALKLLTVSNGILPHVTAAAAGASIITTKSPCSSTQISSSSLSQSPLQDDGGSSINNEMTASESTPEQKQLLYKRIVQSYANYLRINGKFVDACLMYERSGDIHQAILTAKHILDWKKCLTLLKYSIMSEEDATQLILSFVPALQENGRHREAADLIKIYQNNYDSIVEILLNGKLYNDAIYEARLNADDLIERKIRPNLERYTFSLMVSLDGAMKEFNGYKNRLITIRHEKELRRLTKLNEMAGSPNDNYRGMIGDDSTDGFSDTSSMDSSKYSSQISRGSGRSHRSSKNRRKHERKIMSLKEGNPFEEIALIDPIYNLILKWYNQQMHINDVCKALINLEMDSDGQCLQDMFGKLLICIKNSLDEIWIPEMITSIQVPTDVNIDYNLYQDEQRYAMIKPHQRFKPQLTITDWEFEVLK